MWIMETLPSLRVIYQMILITGTSFFLSHQKMMIKILSNQREEL